MAIVRCEKCGLDHSRTKHPYHHTAVLPLGYPDTGVICGKKECTSPGRVWLQKTEYDAYQRGERYFSVSTYTVKVKVI